MHVCVGGHRAVGTGPWAQGHGHRAVGTGPWAQGHGHKAVGTGPWAQGRGQRSAVAGLGAHAWLVGVIASPSAGTRLAGDVKGGGWEGVHRASRHAKRRHLRHSRTHVPPSKRVAHGIGEGEPWRQPRAIAANHVRSEALLGGTVQTASICRAACGDEGAWMVPDAGTQLALLALHHSACRRRRWRWRRRALEIRIIQGWHLRWSADASAACGEVIVQLELRDTIGHTGANGDGA